MTKSKKMNKRRYTRKTRKNRKRKTKKRGGNANSVISNPSTLVKQKPYLIQFYNDEDNDDVESEFSPTHNGKYIFIDSRTLYPYHSKSSISYYIFERNGQPIYLFHETEPITWNNKTTYFQMPVHYTDQGTITSESPRYRWSDDYYNETRAFRYRCNVYKTYTTTDLLNVSRVSRLNKSKNANTTLPIEMERTIQSFMVGEDKFH